MAGMKRQRGRGRKSSGGHNQSRNFESNGPDIKIRGSASHVYDKYQQLARDAQSSGDRIAAESYLQHAEHYFRVLRSQQQHQQRDRADEAGRGESSGYANGRDDYDDASGSGEQDSSATQAPSSSSGPLDVVDPEAVEAAGGEQDEGRSRRPRRRRRYEGPGAEGSGEQPEASSSAPLDRASSS